MNRGQGFTASAIVLAGVLFRAAPTSNSSPLPNPPSGSIAPAGLSGALQERGDGPWKASCNYWKPGRWIDDEAKGSRKSAAQTDPRSQQLAITVTEKGTTFDSHVNGTLVEPDNSCGSDGWGIPSPVEGAKDPLTPQITALIATVPDPVHSSMAIEFDRSVDVLMQAAEANDYVGSYFWLPWERPLATGKQPRTANDVETKEDPDREKQPGLIILKGSGSTPQISPSSKPGPDAAPVLKHDVVYLFLVGQTPALGVNGDQLQRALHYEADLRRSYHAHLSLRSTDEADVIGPNNSGSAASLRAGLESVQFETGPFDPNIPPPAITKISVAGITSLGAVSDLLNSATMADRPKMEYISFGDNTGFEQQQLTELFQVGHRDVERLAFLLESGTLYGQNLYGKKKTSGARDPLVIHFPREISLLRNASKEAKTTSDQSPDNAASPYLHLSLKESSVEDTVKHFSPELSPFSQEAQWMAIVRELKRRRVEVIAISASNTLDELFLAKSLNRELPDARLVFIGSSDLMFVRYSDNSAYLGSIAFTAYPFTALSRSDSSQRLHNFANAWTESLYNAAMYTFWNKKDIRELRLADYQRSTDQASTLNIPLWATVVGRDGYYPLGIIKPCASDHRLILPSILPNSDSKKCTEVKAPALTTATFNADHHSFPTFSWYLLCLILIFLCTAHSLVLLTASFWSPFTRDLAITHSDQPRRRAVYIHIATAMLVSMSFITAWPVFTTFHLLKFNGVTVIAAVATLGSGLLAALFTCLKTKSYLLKSADPPSRKGSPCRSDLPVEEKEDLASEASLYPWFNLIALLTAVVIPALWVYLCQADGQGETISFVGLFFGYRCLYPASGVSPLLPILLLLSCWYLWALAQTRRLRFSENSRPMLPGRLAHLSRPIPLYVADDVLVSCSGPVDSCLYENITCLLITRQIVRRFLHRPGSGINGIIACIYLLLFAIFVVCLPIQGLDRFLRHATSLTPYEFLISALFYPLLVVALTGGLRMLYIWNALKHGLLEPLERSPLRGAFSRLTNVAWMTMFRQAGIFEYWRDMTRSIEAIQQMSHDGAIFAALNSAELNPAALPSGASTSSLDVAKGAFDKLKQHVGGLQALIKATGPAHRRRDDRPQPWDAEGNFLFGRDLPHILDRGELNLMCAIECDYAKFAEALLSGVLVPFWHNERCSPVESNLPPSPVTEETSSQKEKGAGAAPDASDSTSCADPHHIRLAEEFLAIRYLSLMRSILINIRQLMAFISAAFVLAIIAWNSYPFQPRQWIDWAFTGLLLLLGTAVVWVFAQMHRDPILSRITGTAANELGSGFYLRLVTFGAVPVLTWIASQFPAFGGTISKLLQSGLGLPK